MSTTVVSWNIGKRQGPWHQLADIGADVALLQEAGLVPQDVAERVDTGPREHRDSYVWHTRWHEGRFEKLFDRWPMVAKLSDRVEVEWFRLVSPISETRRDEIAVSGIDTIADARITLRDGSPFVAVSMYARKIHLVATSRAMTVTNYILECMGHVSPRTSRT